VGNQTKLVLLVALLISSFEAFSQTGQNPLRWVSPNGNFDLVTDRFGNTYDLADLATISSKPIGGSNTVQSIPSVSCNTGYFDLYFAAGSYFASSAPARSVACEVFLTLSTLINMYVVRPKFTKH